MPALVTRFTIEGTKEEVSPARRMVVEQLRAWGVSLDDETADAIRLIASELLTNAVVHGRGPISVALRHRPGSLLIEVFDSNHQGPQECCAEEDDESGRGLTLVGCFAARCGWEPTRYGKRVWAEIALPKPAPAIRAAALRQFLAAKPAPGTKGTPGYLMLAVA
ncbi:MULTISPECIES: ATP-binding protein [unclassified Streptomyces]|uniref:ATP-binding protein n=1 Tax=unclassified Streptomyces TaxID=2593676 RepID=UPI0018F87E55|nr:MULTISPECIES: ATP-binding protein [unclassified Streptomyces]